MKIILLFSTAAAVFGFSSASAQTLAFNTPRVAAEASAAKAGVAWRSTQHNFGEIVLSVPVTASFTFTNTGTAPVLLTQVQGSCGCTATTYPKEAVLPGKSAAIMVTYNAATLGSFNKTVTVTTSADGGPQVLSLRGTVVAAR